MRYVLAMNDLMPNDGREVRKATKDEMAAFITEMFDETQNIAARAPLSAHLLQVWAAHVDENRRADVPENVVEGEFFSALQHLELRIARIERALEKTGVALGDMPPLIRAPRFKG